jgi:GT2 family glycosyltransferase
VGIVVTNTSLEVLERTISSLKTSKAQIKIILLCNSSNAGYIANFKHLCNTMGVSWNLTEINAGFGAGHNNIVKASNSDWYVCCNPDVEILPETITKLIDFGERYNDSILVAPRIVNWKGETEPLSRSHLSIQEYIKRQSNRLFGRNLFKTYETQFDYSKSQPMQFVSGCFFAIRRKHFEELKGFDGRFFLYCEDADLSFRASRLGTNYFCHDAVIRHQWAKGWTHSRKLLLVHLRSLAKYFLKHGFTTKDTRFF